MKHPHEHIIIAYAADTSVEIEAEASNWQLTTIEHVIKNPLSKFRIKPATRSITLQDGTVVEWPEPMRVAPADGTRYWIVTATGVGTADWQTHHIDISVLKAGFCHLTEEAAQQHRRAIVLANGGVLADGGEL